MESLILEFGTGIAFVRSWFSYPKSIIQIGTVEGKLIGDYRIFGNEIFQVN
jgi:hypothetical protein